MRFGAFISPYHRPDGDSTGSLERDLALVGLLEDLGYDEAWFGEHHSGGWETIASPELMVAAAAQRTSRIALGTGVISLPYHHPFMVAERVVMLDHLTRGRSMIGVGSGALEADARMLGIDPADRGIMFEERLGALQALLRDSEPITRRGRGFTLDHARLQSRPYSTPHPPLYVASSFAGAGLSLAARHGAGLLLVGSSQGSAAAFHAAAAEVARAGCPIDRTRALVVLNIHVGETRHEAREAIREGATAEQYEYWCRIVGMPQPDYPACEHVDKMIERGQLIAGTPGECVDALRDFLAALGPVGGILIAAREWAPARETRRSYELFARDVAPAFRRPFDTLRALATRRPDRRAERVPG